MGTMDFTSKPDGLWKWVLHAPTWLFRARLGVLMGSRFVMIEHRGRKSGTLYRTPLEVAGRTQAMEYVVTSGTGPNADWYRNLRAGGFDAIWIGSRKHEADVRFLEADEAADVFAEYERDHPKAAQVLMDKMGVGHDGSPAGRVEMMHAIPMVGYAVD